MTSVPTLTVYWPAKFGQRTVVITADAFDAAVHRLASDGPPVPVAPTVSAPASDEGDGLGANRAPRRRRTE